MSSLKVLVYTLGITVWLRVCQASSNKATLQLSPSTESLPITVSVTSTNTATDAVKSSTSVGLSAIVVAATSNVITKASSPSFSSAEQAANSSAMKSTVIDSSSSQFVSASSMVQSQKSVSGAASSNSLTRSLSPSVSQSRILDVSRNSSLYQTRSQTSVFRSMTQSPTILPTKRSTVFIVKTSVSSSMAAKVTSKQMPAASMLSASGQSSKKTYSHSAVVQSFNVVQSTPVESSSVGGKSLFEGLITMTTQHVERSLVTSMKNITISAGVIATTSSQSVPPITSAVQPRPTLPPQGTKLINMEVSFDLAFKEEYNDPNSPEYKSLERNITMALENVYKIVKGFVGVRIILIKRGSVVCRFIVILAKDSEVDGNDLKETLQRASESGKLGYAVKNIEVKVEAITETVEKLPEWALVIMILLGCLAFIFLLALIHFCVKHRRSVVGESDMYLMSSGEVGLVKTYDRVSMVENNKNQGYQGQKSAVERRVIGSHANPTYGANGALGD